MFNNDCVLGMQNFTICFAMYLVFDNNLVITFSSRKVIDLSLNDWLDGLQKTVRCSIQEHQDKESEGNQHFDCHCLLNQGTHCTGKTGKMTKKICVSENTEFGHFANNREFGLLNL